MRWADKFFESIDRYAGTHVKQEVFKAGGKLGSGATSKRRISWVKTVLDRLSKQVDDETLKKILTATCPHTYPHGRIQKMRKKYEKRHDVDQLLESMRSDLSWKGKSYYDNPERKDDIIYVTKVPRDPQAHQKATTKDEKQAAYCHCPWIRAALNKHEEVNPLFCYCSTGWDKQLWEGILEKHVKVEVEKSLLRGDDCCVHAVHLPPDTT